MLISNDHERALSPVIRYKIECFLNQFSSIVIKAIIQTNRCCNLSPVINRYWVMKVRYTCSFLRCILSWIQQILSNYGKIHVGFLAFISGNICFDCKNLADPDGCKTFSTCADGLVSSVLVSASPLSLCCSMRSLYIYNEVLRIKARVVKVAI